MISLSTGLPGAGKTLFTIAFVKALAEKENRPVFYSGITDLILPWHEIDAEKWPECPAGAIIVIDECQRIFRPRGSAAKVPDYVMELETHRHKGLDIFLITQHPMLMDANVRRLTERHWHICRRFGMQRATIFQYESCKEQPLSNTGSGQRMDWRYPKEAYSYYKSAEVHTVKRRIPVYYYVIAAAIIGIVGSVWLFYTRHYEEGQIVVLESQRRAGAASTAGTPSSSPGVVHGDVNKPSSSNSSSFAGVDKKPMTTAEYIEHYQPRLSGLAYTAPAYDKVTEPEEAPVPVACISSASKGCRCYSQQATRLQMDASLCLQIVKHGFFRAFSTKAEREATRRSENPAKAQETPSVPAVIDNVPSPPVSLIQSQQTLGGHSIRPGGNVDRGS